MKTAISIPDPLFKAAEKLVKHLRVSRSELYANAIADYVERHQVDSVKAALDRVYAEDRGSVDPLLSAMQLKSLPREDW
jgi:metal-responsive CopG/Arc/MetJ family transcriptional regulator